MNGDTHYDERIRPIKCIEFNILGNDEIKRMSALGKDSTGIEIPDLYDNMEPKRGGLIDTRLGTTINSLNCATCGLDSTYCIGHPGHIDLADPAFHLGFLPYVKKILSCVCLKCSNLLIYKTEDEIIEMLKDVKANKRKLNMVREITKSATYCAKPNVGCGSPVTKIKLEAKKTSGLINIISEVEIQGDEGEGGDGEEKKKIKRILTPEMCQAILHNISDIDCMIMGIIPSKSRPENMIHTTFPVSPVAIRPSAKVDFLESSTKEDDLTHKLADIVKANVRIRKLKENTNDTAPKYGVDHQNLLQYHIYTNFDNESAIIPKSEQRNKAATKSLSSRLKGKEGRIRCNLQGKRVNFSGRTVITGDPTNDLNQLRVPIKIATTLTSSEVVTPQNIEKLTELVKNGRDKYPGANFVFPASNLRNDKQQLPVDLRYRKERVDLKFGDVVERHIVDGDIVLLNRQPTLHKLSMMGFRVKVIKNWKINSFGLNVLTCKPFNADFDGDEMNIFLPQSEQTKIELAEIADVQKQIITPASSTPIIGIVQDGLLASYNLTQPTMKIDWKSAMNIISYTTFDKLSSFKKEDISGTDLFSLIIPGKINVSGDLEVKNGQITKGSLSSKSLGAGKPHNIIHLVWNQYGPEKTRIFLNDTQRLLNNFNLWNGFSVGIGDIDVSLETEKQIHTLIETKKLEVDHLITEMENNHDLIPLDIFESTIKGELDTLRSTAGKIIIENLKPENNFSIMSDQKSGSKGNVDNIAQMAACVGQQGVEGKRLQKKFNGRASVYCHQHDDSALGRGFVEQPFYRGIHPKSFIYHNMASREGLIDTAIKTAESGYVQRKLIKAGEDISVKYDNTVRNSNNTIIQFMYGDSGIDTTKQAYYNLNMLEMSNAAIATKIKFTDQELKNYSGFNKTNQEYYENVLKLRNIIRKNRIATSLDTITFENGFMLPVNIKNIIVAIKNGKTKDSGELTPQYVVEKLEEILDYSNTKLTSMTKAEYNNKNSLRYRDEMVAKTAFKFALYEFLSPKIAILDHSLSKSKFDEVCKKICIDFNKSVVEPGEMVGIISAQSIGEPTTQLTLNTFHATGIRSSASLGVPRVKELLSLSKNIKTPETTIYLKKAYRNNHDVANRIGSHLKHTILMEVRKKIDIFYDPEPLEKGSFMDQDNVYNVFYSHNPSKNSCQADIASLPWLLRIELDREKMIEKDITLLDIKSKYCNNWEKRYNDSKGQKKEEKQLLERISQTAILSNSDNDQHPVIHIRFDMTEFDFSILVSFIDVFVDNFKLKGIENIKKIQDVAEQQFVSFDNEDEELKKDKHYVIYTDGVNLQDIRYLNGIDLNNTICNDIMVIYETYGIDAARAALMKEFKNVFVSAGSKVNFAHLELLCDLITNTGTPISIDRHGMNKSDTDPLARASFEKTVDQMITAAVFCEVDNMNNVSSRIMGGLPIKGGTGLCDIILDSNLLEKSEYTEDIEQTYVKTFNEVGESTIISDIINKDENDGFFVPM